MIPVAYSFAMQDRSQSLAFYAHQLWLVERGIRGVQSHLGIVAQVLQQLAELLVLIRYRFVINIIICHQGEKFQPHAGVLAMQVDDIVESVERVFFLACQDTHTFPQGTLSVVRQKVAPHSCQRPENSFVPVAICGVDVDCVFEIEIPRGDFDVLVARFQFAGKHQCPSVNYRHLEESLLICEAFRRRKASMRICEMRQVFLIARQAEECRGENVEREIAFAVVDRKERIRVFVLETAWLLLLDCCLEQQVRTTHKKPLTYFVAAITHLGTVETSIQIGVCRYFEFGFKDIPENYI